MTTSNPVEAHYKNLLAADYSWMCGGLEQGIDQSRLYFKELGISSGKGHVLDLGCGPGMQSIALAELGYDVVAVDFNEELLDELRMYQLNQRTQYGQQLKIGTRCIDLTELKQESFAEQFDIVVCLGDTLTHLPDHEAVARLIDIAVNQLLTSPGKIIIGYRDLTKELTGTDRIIPVRLEAEKVMLTFLEYFPEKVHVHDTILNKKGDSWNVNKSWYPKLRISQHWLMDEFQKLGLKCESTTNPRGLTTIIASR